jgi:hypothetical protein
MNEAPRMPGLAAALRQHQPPVATEQVFLGAMHRLDQITARLDQLIDVQARAAEALTRVAEVLERAEAEARTEQSDGN